MNSKDPFRIASQRITLFSRAVITKMIKWDCEAGVDAVLVSTSHEPVGTWNHGESCSVGSNRARIGFVCTRVSSRNAESDKVPDLLVRHQFRITSETSTVNSQIRSPLERLRIGVCLLVTAMIVGVIGFRLLGDYGWLESLWMVVITVTTVGFGEKSQSPPSIQILTIGLILFGMSAMLYTTTGFFQFILEGELERTLGFRRMTRQIDKLRNHTIICGLGLSGQSLAADLAQRGRGIVVIEQDPERLSEAAEMQCLVVDGDATQESTLIRAGIERAASLVIALPSDADNVFITLTARELNPLILIVARASQEHTAKKLRQAGAQKVVMPAAVSAKLMSRMVLAPSAADWLELLAESSYAALDIEELVLSEHSKLVGKSLREAEAQRTHQLLVVAVRDGEGAIIANPGADYVFQTDDVAILMGNAANISQFRDLYRV